MKDKHVILVINSGSTSTKISIFENEEAVMAVSARHPREELKQFETVWEQYDYRTEIITGEIKKHGFNIADIDIIACRGGNIKPVRGGIYEVTDKMIADIKSGQYGIHPTGVGNLIAHSLSQEYGIPVITLDPPATDEFCAWARLSGIPQITRQSSFHALNQKATARKVAEELGREYEDLNMIVVHMGGGISVGAHCAGAVIDVNNALDGDGPYSPERAGGIPNSSLIKMCFSGEYSREEMLRLMNGGGGLVAYLGTSDALEVEKRIKKGDESARNVYMGMAYQVVKEIGAMAAALAGDVDAVAFSGSLVYSDMLMSFIRPRIEFIGPIFEMPGENEMEALAAGALRYLRGTQKVNIY